MIKALKSLQELPAAQLIENQPAAPRLRVWQLPAAPCATPFEATFAPARATPGGALPREVCLPLSERPLALSGQIGVQK